MNSYLIDLVEKINYDLFDQKESLVTNRGVVCELNSIGYDTCIKFLGVVIWDSEEDERECGEEDQYTETIDEFVRRRINELVEDLQGIEL